ncbi:MAG: FHA domain-containing protein [Gammaproteobacteria bacterium]|nr:FHA domain-containing protein [Gammaproteobacteria bacterium]
MAFFSYSGQEKAFEFFRSVYEHNTGLGLFQGPHLSGKTTIIRHFAEQQKDQCAVAIVNGEGINTSGLLESILRSFGYQHKFDSLNELLSMVKVVIRQQTAGGKPPLLFVENTHAMNPSSLHILCDLAAVRVREKFAIRIVLASDRTIDYIPRAPAMECIAKRLTGDFHLNPLTIDETSDYLYAKMRQGGCIDPDFVFPDAVCDELYRASGGWPGVLDRLAMLAIENAEHCPVGLEDVEHPPVPKSTRQDITDMETGPADGKVRNGPLLFLTRNGETLRKIRFDGSRLLIGRTEHNDLHIESKYVSRHHAMLVRHGNSTLLMDLNSANGTFVNSRRISNQVMANDDVITLGEFGLKFVDPGAQRHETLEGISLDETVVMMTLDDMRKVLVRENTAILPTVPGPVENNSEIA